MYIISGLDCSVVPNEGISEVSVVGVVGVRVLGTCFTPSQEAEVLCACGPSLWPLQPSSLLTLFNLMNTLSVPHPREGKGVRMERCIDHVVMIELSPRGREGMMKCTLLRCTYLVSHKWDDT